MHIVPDILTLWNPALLIWATILWGKLYYSNFEYEETQNQRWSKSTKVTLRGNDTVWIQTQACQAPMSSVLLSGLNEHDLEVINKVTKQMGKVIRKFKNYLHTDRYCRDRWDLNHQSSCVALGTENGAHTLPSHMNMPLLSLLTCVCYCSVFIIVT